MTPRRVVDGETSFLDRTVQGLHELFHLEALQFVILALLSVRSGQFTPSLKRSKSACLFQNERNV